MMMGAHVGEGGYVCVPYLHNTSSITLKEIFVRSENVKDLYLATASFSEDGGAYFPSRTNTYLLGRYTDHSETSREVDKHKQEKPTFVFSKKDEFFERHSDKKLNYVSIYYVDGHSDEDLTDLAIIVAKRHRVRRAEWGDLNLASTELPKFTFPYGNSLVVLEVSSDNTHQSDNKYCEKTRREVARRGVKLVNLLNLSIIEKIK